MFYILGRVGCFTAVDAILVHMGKIGLYQKLENHYMRTPWAYFFGPLFFTWFDLNPSMDK